MEKFKNQIDETIFLEIEELEGQFLDIQGLANEIEGSLKDGVHDNKNFILLYILSENIKKSLQEMLEMVSNGDE